MDLALNNLQRLICHKTNKPNQTIDNKGTENTLFQNSTYVYFRFYIFFWVGLIDRNISCGILIYGGKCFFFIY